MKQLKQIFLAVALLAAFGAAPKAQAHDAWSGVYGTGGYQLYTLGSDIYNLGGYMTNQSYGSGWYGGGSSCASFINPCSGGYDSANLYPYYGSSYGGYNIDIKIDISLPSYGYGYGYGYQQPCSFCFTGCNFCSGGQSSCGMSTYSYSPCSQYPQYPSYPTFPSYPTYPSWPTTPPTYSWPTWPTWPTTPPTNTLPRNPYINDPTVVIDITTPPTLPPWGGCGNVVQCPTGPVIPPAPQPTTTWKESTSPTSPVRYKVPRGTH